MSGFSTFSTQKIKNGPIMVVDDNPADQKLFEIALRSISAPNKLLVFNNGSEALSQLKKIEEYPFIIICDINMPVMSGIELKKEIEKDKVLSLMSIPFIFMSSSASLYDVKEAFCMKAQGYFQKPNELSTLEEDLRVVLSYWTRSEVPSLF